VGLSLAFSSFARRRPTNRTDLFLLRCFKSELLKGRTVLLATHHISLVTPVASFILRLGRDGKVEAQGPVEKLSKEDDKIEKEVAAEKKEVSSGLLDSTKTTSQLILPLLSQI